MNKKKIGRNDLCPCGSGKKYKKCCPMDERDNYPLPMLVEDDGIHIALPFETTSAHKIENMTKQYQEMVRNSPLWDEIVRKQGKGKAEELLKEFQVKFK